MPVKFVSASWQLECCPLCVGGWSSEATLWAISQGGVTHVHCMSR